ncbi:MAG TPA: hypothetical protein DCY13_05950 [Verrucomicrobiales bacterium]|nr:hypothetical protein [Verrucomicrobiales bacterium]
MPARQVECPKCRTALPDQPAAAGLLTECPSCSLTLRLHTFPALFRTPEMGGRGTAAITAGEATCFHHEQKRAVATCEECGKFLCQLCDVTVEEAHFCPQCLQLGVTRGSLRQLERGRARHDQVMLGIVLLSFLFWAVPLLPLAALILGLLKWKAPVSMVHRTHLRMGITMSLALVQFLGGTAFWIAVWMGGIR